MNPPVIDVCAIYFDQDGWEAYLRGFAVAAPQYLRVFAKPLANASGVDATAVARLAHADPHAAVDLILDGTPLSAPVEQYAAELHESGIAHQVIHSLPYQLTHGESLNDRVAALTRRYPELLSVWAGLSLRDVAAAVEEVHRCYTELGMRGASVIPFLDGVDPADTACTPVFDACEALGIPVWIHAGQSFRADVPLDLCGWRQIDTLAGRHPRLRIVVGHGGWPFLGEFVAVCQRHPNVSLELSSHTGRSILADGSGWGPLLLHGRRALRTQVLFGSAAWVHDRSVRSLADELAGAAGDEGVARDWLHDNASRLVGVRSAPGVKPMVGTTP